jgi:molybdenum cofactor cytidylyltransferase
VSTTERFERLVEAFDLPAPPGLVAIVGGGGKSSLMFALARQLRGRVVMTTTTRIFAAQLELAENVCTADDPMLAAHLQAGDTNWMVVGRVAGDRAGGVAATLPGELLAHASVSWVVVEADGSRMLPVKAPAEHEPVIPPETTLLVVVAGIDALGGPIEDVAHRPDRVCAVTGLSADECLTPGSLARLLTSREGGLKNAPPSSRVVVLLNKVEKAADWEAARETARRAIREPGIDRVVIGALREGAGDGWEAWTRGEPG